MGAYILKRILLMIPTLLGIMLMTFAVIQSVDSVELAVRLDRLVRLRGMDEGDARARMAAQRGSCSVVMLGTLDGFRSD